MRYAEAILLVEVGECAISGRRTWLFRIDVHGILEVFQNGGRGNCHVGRSACLAIGRTKPHAT